MMGAISHSQFPLAIIAMAVITFGVRYAFFMSSLQFNLHPRVKNLLTFTAPCILTAMFVPIMFQDVIKLAEVDVASLQLSLVVEQLLTSSYFWASIATIILSLFVRQTLVVIILGMLIFYGLRVFFNG